MDEKADGRAVEGPEGSGDSHQPRDRRLARASNFTSRYVVITPTSIPLHYLPTDVLTEKTTRSSSHREISQYVSLCSRQHHTLLSRAISNGSAVTPMMLFAFDENDPGRSYCRPQTRSFSFATRRACLSEPKRRRANHRRTHGLSQRRRFTMPRLTGMMDVLSNLTA